MKTLKFVLLFISFSIFGQEVATPKAEIGKTYNFSKERQAEWDSCIEKMTRLAHTEQTQEQMFAVAKKCSEIDFSEACDDIWSVVCGDDWTDEGYPYNTIDLSKAYNYLDYIKQHPEYQFNKVSSALKPQGEHEYGSKSISDLNYKTAWVEGVKGYGIGEYTIFEFQPGPRINEVIIANGYIKDKKTWKNNSRVKQLKMYLNNELFAILNLQDVYAEQSFKVPVIGTKNDLNKTISGIKIKFEISAVYKGDKYDDTAITEIYFDGLDVY